MPLFHGDVLEVLQTLESESVDMVFADPPFNVGIKYVGKSSNDDRPDYPEWCAAWIAECFRVLKPTGTFYLMTITRHLEHLYPFNTYAQTRKIAKGNMRWGGYTTEPKGQLLDYWNDIPFVYAGSIAHSEAILKPGTNEKAHPAQMPVNLPARAILFSTDEDDTVLDPFSGSGTTWEAAEKLGRQFIGIEKEAEYVEMARKRLAKIRLSPTFFMPSSIAPNTSQERLFSERSEQE